jgi:hypothetical protein
MLLLILVTENKVEEHPLNVNIRVTVDDVIEHLSLRCGLRRYVCS